MTRRLLPSVAAERSRRYERRFRDRLGVTAAARKIQGRYGDEVRHGPFAGMMLLADWPTRNAPVLNLLGAYEAQLHPVLEEVIELAPRMILNLGCADGYYAVGLARRVPRARVYAHDLSRDARRGTEALAERNDVADRVVVNHRLRRVPDGIGLLVCDIEGAESRLFTAPVVHRLPQTVVVVEAHEGSVPGVGQLLRDRFGATHKAEVVGDLPVNPAAFDELAVLTQEEREAATSEFREERIDWLIFRPTQVET